LFLEIALLATELPLISARIIYIQNRKFDRQMYQNQEFIFTRLFHKYNEVAGSVTLVTVCIN